MSVRFVSVDQAVAAFVRSTARREVEYHQKRFIGITATAPELKDLNGSLEFACDVRVGVKEGWGIIKDVILTQWVVGVVADMNVPVLCERSEAGRVTIIARSEMRLPDISYTVYSLESLGLAFMYGLTMGEDGVWRDGFGHAVAAPAAFEETQIWSWDQDMIEWGDAEFVYGTTPLEKTVGDWEVQQA